MTPHKAANRTTIGAREYLEPGTQGDNMDIPVQAEQAGRRADDSDWMDHAVRVGLVSYGIVHLIIAWLALRLAFGDGGGSASSQGALQQVAKTGVGQVSLYVAGLGFVALVVWQALEAIWGHRDEDGGKRVLKRLTSAAKVVLYVSLAVSAARTAAGSSSGSGGTDGMTAKVMELPGGPVLVGAVGVGVLVVAGFLAFRGLSEGFRSKLDSGGQTGKDGRAYVLFGKIGYVAKAVALAIVGVLFLYAAVTHDPDKSAGLDQALHKLIQQPFGSPLLVLVALGFACYGLFAFAWARHLDR
jgi:type IV secretory pathway VirB2 component (pilin)